MLIPNNDINVEFDVEFNNLLKINIDNNERNSRTLELKEIRKNTLKQKISEIFKDQQDLAETIQSQVMQTLRNALP